MAALMLLTCLLVFVLLVTFALVAAVTDLVSAITDAERRQHIEPLQPLWHKYPVLLSLPVPRFRVANADNEL
jgi:hypothetical protein